MIAKRVNIFLLLVLVILIIVSNAQNVYPPPSKVVQSTCTNNNAVTQNNGTSVNQTCSGAISDTNGNVYTNQVSSNDVSAQLLSGGAISALDGYYNVAYYLGEPTVNCGENINGNQLGCVFQVNSGNANCQVSDGQSCAVNGFFIGPNGNQLPVPSYIGSPANGNAVAWGPNGTLADAGFVSSHPITYTATSPITITSSNIAMSQAGANGNGWLSSANWNTFNNKGSGNGTVTINGNSTNGNFAAFYGLNGNVLNDSGYNSGSFLSSSTVIPVTGAMVHTCSPTTIGVTFYCDACASGCINSTVSQAQLTGLGSGASALTLVNSPGTSKALRIYSGDFHSYGTTTAYTGSLTTVITSWGGSTTIGSAGLPNTLFNSVSSTNAVGSVVSGFSGATSVQYFHNQPLTLTQTSTALACASGCSTLDYEITGTVIAMP